MLHCMRCFDQVATCCQTEDCGNATPAVCQHASAYIIAEHGLQRAKTVSVAQSEGWKQIATRSRVTECFMQRMLPGCCCAARGRISDAKAFGRSHAQDSHPALRDPQRAKILSHVFMECLQCLPSGVPKCTTPQCGRHSVSCSETATVLVQQFEFMRDDMDLS